MAQAKEGACCPPDSHPPLTETSGFHGTTISIEGVDSAGPLPLYLTSPIEAAVRVAVVFTDVFGPDSGHHKRFCDHLAKSLGEGWTVVMPDLFRGAPAMQPYSFLPNWLAPTVGALPMIYRLKFRHGKETTVDRDLVQVLLPWLKKSGVSTMTCCGFCFGGWMVGQALAIPETPFTCGIGLHPSWNVEKLHGRTEAELAAAVGSTPCLMLPAANDSDAIKPGGECTRILAAARQVSETEVSVPYIDMKHGWCTRGDDADEKVARDQADALERCAAFMLKYGS